MSVGSDPVLARVRDATSCRQWLGELPAGAAERLSAIGGLMAQLARPGIEPDPLFEVLEQVRIEQVRAIDRWLAPLVVRPVPYAESEWERLASALSSLRASRDLFKRAYSAMLGRHGDDTRSIIPGATNALRVAMPLARALDAQARIVSLLLRHRCAPLAADWDALCVLARHMRRTTFQDETLLDEVPLVKPMTARALFVYPLLLQAAALPSRVPAESDFADRLASRLAAKVGYRIDHGAPEDNPYGPTFALTPEHAVRFDAHRLPASIARRRQQWLAAVGESPSRKSMPLAESATHALLEDLERRWTGASLFVAPGAAGADAAPTARLRFGLPRIHAADMQARPDVRAQEGAADAPYEYGGRWEQNTIMRLALGSDVDRRNPAALVMAEGETVDRVETAPGARISFVRHGSTPRAELGALVAIAPATGLSLATIESIEQIPEPDHSRSSGQRITTRCWPGKPVPAGVKIGEALSFIDAWLLPGDAAVGELPSLLVAPGRAHAGARAVLREPERDVPIRFASLIERGPGYERLSLRIESPRPSRGPAGEFG
ncbi:MAG: hypothetical protein KF786_09700 [Burkholderiaceae bacterium]|jgi:hypothetical protein|nr:hypothetical protein [Burkholderiaceae bacterium]